MITSHTLSNCQIASTFTLLTSPIVGMTKNLSPYLHPYFMTILLRHSLLQMDHSIKSSMSRSALPWTLEISPTARRPTSQNRFSLVTNDMIAIRMQWNVCYHSCLRCSQQRTFGYSRWVLSGWMKWVPTPTLHPRALHMEGPNSSQWSRIQSSMDQRWSAWK